ncbi:hypothetical protein, partial [Brevundimonas sp.]|uniref:hypothetical protein n=1 Tax=Brevundimonas sp. TaxID=1871086 RepID=UPI0025C54E80
IFNLAGDADGDVTEEEQLDAPEFSPQPPRPEKIRALAAAVVTSSPARAASLLALRAPADADRAASPARRAKAKAETRR